MQAQIIKYFENQNPQILSENPPSSWEVAKKEFPRLTKGWYELATIQDEVRQEFLRDYWINALPYSPQLYAFVDRFFAKVVETEIVAIKGGIFLTYGMRDEKGFYLGGPPLSDVEVSASLNPLEFPFPSDFLRFFRIHNGFFKGGDTGILSIGVMIEEADRFRSLDLRLKMGRNAISTASLFPFYRSFGLDVYQCFYQDWYPDGGVGNVLCSLSEETVSDYHLKETGNDQLAFPSFLEWLMFYMEDISGQCK
ncbi:MAG: hypothetical protein HRU43_03910 [Simkaniaceae bacterium]|nr:hypothetical protein [Simkaniaceae bacterium]